MWKKLRIKTWSRPKSLVKMLSQSGRVVLCSCHVSFWSDGLFRCGFHDFQKCLAFIQELIGPTWRCEPWESCDVHLLYMTINEHKEIFWAFRRLQHPTNSTELTSFWTNHLSSLKIHAPYRWYRFLCSRSYWEKNRLLIPTSVFFVVGRYLMMPGAVTLIAQLFGGLARWFGIPQDPNHQPQFTMS